MIRRGDSLPMRDERFKLLDFGETFLLSGFRRLSQ